MRILTVYYSRTGRVETIAKIIATNLASDIEKIHDQENRDGIWKALIAGLAAGMKKSTTIASTKFNPEDYDLVIIGTPVWASNMSCAIRAWLQQYGKKLKHVAFFATMGSNGSEKTFTAMAELAQQTPITTLALTDKQIATNNYQQQLEQFLAAVKK